MINSMHIIILTTKLLKWYTVQGRKILQIEELIFSLALIHLSNLFLWVAWTDYPAFCMGHFLLEEKEKLNQNGYTILPVITLSSFAYLMKPIWYWFLGIYYQNQDLITFLLKCH